jgi:CRISPR-associated protein Csd1
LLVSFNKGAFTSYGKEQSFNAPVGKTAAFKYATALNLLLSSRERRIRIGDATLVHWADHHTPVEDVFAQFFQDSPAESASSEEVQEDVKRLEHAKQLLLQMRSGTEPIKWKTDDIPTRFFILGLSPNASRLSLRFWIEADSSEILHRLETHIRDLSLNGVEQLPSIWRIAQATGRWNNKENRYDSDSISPKLAGDLTRAILTGTAYPQSLMATLIRRIFMDGHIRSDRVCAIKACLVRNSRPTANPLEIPMELDRKKPDIAYQCGRIFALLEAVQRLSVKQSSNAELNATIKDHYFSSACSTPALVFPRLCRLSQHHLSKISPPPLRNYFEREISQAMSSENFAFPRRLTLSEQASFIVGYYQQRVFKKDDQTEEDA